MITVTAEQMNVSVSAFDLANEIKNSQSNQRTARQERKRIADPAVDGHAAPNNQHPERGGEEDVTGAGKARHGERFRFRPTLGPGGDDKRKPVRWNDRVQKSNRESRRQKCYENNVVHRAVSISIE